MLDAAREIGDGRSHDTGASVELPQLPSVRRTIGAEHPISAALEDEVTRGGEHSAALDDGKAGAPDLALFDRVPRDQMTGWRRRRQQPGQDRTFVARVVADVHKRRIRLPALLRSV